MRNFIVTLLTITIVFAFGGCSAPHSSPEAVLDEWVEAVNARDAQALWSLAADAQVHSGANDIDSYEKFLNQRIEEYGDDFKIEADYSNKNTDGDEAIMDVTITVTSEKIGEESFTDDFRCTKSDGKWYWED